MVVGRRKHSEEPPAPMEYPVNLARTSNRVNYWIFCRCSIILCNVLALFKWLAGSSFHSSWWWPHLSYSHFYHYRARLECLGKNCPKASTKTKSCNIFSQQHGLSEADRSRVIWYIPQLGWHQTVIWCHLEATELLQCLLTSGLFDSSERTDAITCIWTCKHVA